MADAAEVNVTDELLFECSELSISSSAYTGLLRVQVFHRKARAVEEFSQALGLELPGPNAASTIGRHLWLWSAPGEWLVAVPGGVEGDVKESLETTQGNFLSVVSVVTDSRCVFSLSGSNVRGVLARGSNVDFHPASLMPGGCRVACVAGISVLLADMKDTILLVFDSSYRAYVLNWFEAACLE